MVLAAVFFTAFSVQAQTTDNNPVFAGEGVPTQQEWATALFEALGRTGPRFRQMIVSLSKYCGTQENFVTGLSGNCDDLYFQALDNRGDEIRDVLRLLRPREAVQASRTAAQVMNTQLANIGARMAQLRSSSQRISYQANNPALSTLAYLANTEQSSSQYDDLVSPWGFFINGQITDGNYEYADARITDNRNEGYDFNTSGITLGVDYRLNNRLVAGLAIGYANFDSKTDNGANMGNSAFTYSGYGSFSVNDNWYIDAKISYSRPDFDQSRAIDFTLGDNATNLHVTGKTQGTQKAFVLSSGYQFNVNSWSFTPSLSYEYNKTHMNKYKEQGASAWNVGLSEQNFKTNRLTFAFQASKAISLSNGVLIPSFTYEYIDENQNQSVVFMRVSGMPPGEFFESSVNFNDDNYSKVRLGLSFISANGKQAFIQYSRVLAWNGFSIDSLNVGARFEF